MSTMQWLHHTPWDEHKLQWDEHDAVAFLWDEHSEHNEHDIYRLVFRAFCPCAL